MRPGSGGEPATHTRSCVRAPQAAGPHHRPWLRKRPCEPRPSPAHRRRPTGGQRAEAPGVEALTGKTCAAW